MEWPEMDIFSGSAGKLELISRGSWEQEKGDKAVDYKSQGSIFNYKVLNSYRDLLEYHFVTLVTN